MKNIKFSLQAILLITLISCESISQRKPSSIEVDSFQALPQAKVWNPEMSMEYSSWKKREEDVPFDYAGITSRYSIKEQMENPDIRKQIDLYLNSVTNFDNDAQILINGGNSFAKKFELLRSAKNFIMFQGLVLMDDRTGLKVLPILHQKLEEGVVIRILLDSTASWAGSKGMLSDLNNYIRSRYEALSSQYPQFERELRETTRSVWVYKAPKGNQQNIVIQHDEDKKILRKELVDFAAIKKNSGFSMKTVLHVMHNKLLLVDDRAIVGGMNHADNYSHGGLGIPGEDGELVSDASIFEISPEEAQIIDKMIPNYKKKLVKQWGKDYKKNYFESQYGWRDTDMLVKGPVVKRLLENYVRFWTYTSSGKTQDSVKMMSNLFSLKKAPSNPAIPKILARDYIGKETNKMVKGTMMRSVDHIPTLGEIYHTRQTRWLIESATKRVRCQAPYFTLPPEMKKWIHTALKKGVEVEIFTNSITSNDTGAPMTWKARKAYADLLKAYPEKFKVYEWKTATLHSKVCTVDDYVTVIGSSNNDHTSNYLASEIAVSVFDEETAKIMNLAIDIDEEHSDRITWQQMQGWLKKNQKDDGANLPNRIDVWFINVTTFDPIDRFIEKMIKMEIFTH